MYLPAIFIAFLAIGYLFMRRRRRVFQVDISSLGCGILITDKSAIMVDVNKHICEITGYARHELIGKSICVLMEPSLAEFHTNRLKSYTRKYVEGEGFPCIIMGSVNRTISLMCKNGELRSIHLSVCETSTGYVGTVIAKSIDDNVKHSQEMNQRYSVLMHEIRNPLYAGKEYVNMAIEKLDDRASINSAKQDLKVVLNSYEHVLELINDSLELSKLESGKLVFNLQRVDVLSVMEDVALLFRSKAKVPVIVRSNATKPVLIDKKRVSQVIINLLSNAIKFTHSGRIYIDVYFYELDDNFAFVELSVSDTGIGMTIEDQKECFMKYNSKEGTGLGLYISKKLSENFVKFVNTELQQKYNNEFESLKVESPYKDNNPRIERLEHHEEVMINGCRMSFKFPCKIALMNNEQLNVIVSPLSPIDFIQKEIRFLLMDDRVINLNILQCKIRKLFPKSTIECALTGEAGLDKYKQFPFDIIFCDYDMGNGMNGVETLHKINLFDNERKRKSLKVIISGHDIKDIERFHNTEEMMASVDTFFGKPVPDNETIKTVVYNFVKK